MSEVIKVIVAMYLLIWVIGLTARLGLVPESALLCQTSIIYSSVNEC